jgi:glycerate-2-kinase
MTFPAEPLKLDEIKKLTRHLLLSGATINEVNAVRKHTSAIKGGLMAEKAFPATTISLILSDVVGDPLDTIASGPTAPDQSTFHDAVNVLKNHKIWDKASGTIRRRLEMGIKGLIPETPKPGDKIFQKVTNIVVGSNITAARAALKKAQSFNYQSMIISTRIEGEARQVGAMFSSIAHEISSTENPVSKPGAVIAGGETTVTVAGSGTGGRNQELALSAAARIEDLDALIATLATDGIDGPTEAAGAVVDGSTMRKASSMNLNIREFLKKNDSYTFFRNIGDGIITGPTGTNVNDLTIILVPK